MYRLAQQLNFTPGHAKISTRSYVNPPPLQLGNDLSAAGIPEVQIAHLLSQAPARFQRVCVIKGQVERVRLGMQWHGLQQGLAPEGKTVPSRSLKRRGETCPTQPT